MRKVKHLSYKLTEVLMSALAIFGLKYPSLLQFDQVDCTSCTSSTFSICFNRCLVCLRGKYVFCSSRGW